MYNPLTARYRADMISKIRNYFDSKNVLEVETPVLSRGSITDCHIDLFSSWYHLDGYTQRPSSFQLYLQTSPEFHMKRLLAAGFPDIYQISKVFRNGERGRRHNPEFSMIEWYRNGFTIERLMDDVAAICRIVLGDVPERRMTYRDLFIEIAGIDPLVMTLDELQNFCRSREEHVPGFELKSDILNYIMTEYIEPGMRDGELIFVKGFPAEQAVLATIDTSDPRTSNRFELYFNKVELCNGYQELSDWQENRLRLEEENARRASLGKPQIPLDERFINSLQKGIPPCSGVALGLDRLLMLGLGSTSIDDVLAFPFEDA